MSKERKEDFGLARQSGLMITLWEVDDHRSARIQVQGSIDHIEDI